MGYYGQSIYRGDFRRRGGFHPVMLRGDFLDDVGSVLGKVGGYIDKGLSYVGPLGKVLNVANQAFQTVAPHPALQSPQVGGGGLPALPSLQMVKQPGYRGGTAKLPQDRQANQRREDLNDGGRRRRMNVCNGKALRRALRRADGFMRFAKHYVKVIKPGHHVEMKQHHFHKKHKK